MITPQQLKHTNLVFLEHKKLLKEVDLLDCQNKNLALINKNLERADSIKSIQLKRCMLQAEMQDQAITTLNKTMKKWGHPTLANLPHISDMSNTISLVST